LKTSHNNRHLDWKIEALAGRECEPFSVSEAIRLLDMPILPPPGEWSPGGRKDLLQGPNCLLARRLFPWIGINACSPPGSVPPRLILDCRLRRHPRTGAVHRARLGRRDDVRQAPPTDHPGPASSWKACERGESRDLANRSRGQAIQQRVVRGRSGARPQAPKQVDHLPWLLKGGLTLRPSSRTPYTRRMR